MSRHPLLPARFPPHGSWPAVMRADMAAAFLDFDDTAALFRAVARGDAPRPSDVRRRGGSHEPVWDVETCRLFARRNVREDDLGGGDEASVASLI